MSMIVDPYAYGAPPAGDPSIANTTFLCHHNGTNGQTTWTNEMVALGRGTAISSGAGVAVTTSNPLFGTGSTAFIGNGNGLASSHVDYQMGSGDFTLEFAYRTASPSALAEPFDLRTTAVQVAPTIYLNGSQFIYFVNNADRITGGTVLTNTWQRVAVCRVSGTTRLFVDGTQVGSNYTDSNNYNQSSQLTLGCAFNAGASCTGQMDETRITKGVGRYVANYTVAAAEFPNS